MVAPLLLKAAAPHLLRSAPAVAGAALQDNSVKEYRPSELEDILTSSPLLRMLETGYDTYSSINAGVSAPDSGESGFKDAQATKLESPISAADFDIPGFESSDPLVDSYVSPFPERGIEDSTYSHPTSDVPDTSIMHAVKHKGGNFDEKTLDDSLDLFKFGIDSWSSDTPASLAAEFRTEIRGIEEGEVNVGEIYDVDPAEHLQALKQELAEAEINAELNDWIDTKFRKYVKNQMATTNDPVMELARQGKLHIQGGGLEGALEDDYSGQIINNSSEMAERNRMKVGIFSDPQEGYPLQDFTDAAQYWETTTDANVIPHTLGQYLQAGRKEEDWMESAPIDTLIYTPEFTNMGMEHVLDGVHSALSDRSPLPDNLKIAPGKLHKMSVEDVFKRSRDIDDWRTRQAYKAVASKDSQGEVIQEFDDGHTIQKLTKPDQIYFEKEAMGHSLGGYLPTDYAKESGFANYGLGGWDAIKSGKAQIFSLRDKKGKPHVTIEASYGVPEDVVDQLADEYGIAMLDSAKKDWLEANPDKATLQIHQVKAKGVYGGNSKVPDKYLPMVQDFILSNDNVEFRSYNGSYDIHGEGDFDSTQLIKNELLNGEIRLLLERDSSVELFDYGEIVNYIADNFPHVNLPRYMSKADVMEMINVAKQNMDN